MKQILLVLTLVCFGLGLFGCASEDDNKDSAASTTTSNKSTFTLKGAGK